MCTNKTSHLQLQDIFLEQKSTYNIQALPFLFQNSKRSLKPKGTRYMVVQLDPLQVLTKLP